MKLPLLLLTIFTLTAFMAKGKEESSLLVKGIITEKGKKSYQAEVKAYEGNDLIWSTATKPDGTFEFIVPHGKYIALIVEKEGFMSKYVIFDTRSDRMPKNVEPYECHIDLVKESDLEGIDVSRLDFPIAIVQYDKKSRSFNHNQSYTDNMKEDYNYLLNKAALKQNAVRRKKVNHSNE